MKGNKFLKQKKVSDCMNSYCYYNLREGENE